MSNPALAQINEAPMSARQIIVVILGILLFALDGFDVMSISFAAPGIAKEWGIDRAALGFVLAMELIGMSIGSVLIGNIADKVGRRKAILGCLVVMGIGMGLAATVDDLIMLCIYRVITGVGIGGLLPAVTAVVPEFSNEKRRGLAVSIMSSGFPLGAVLGGMAVTQLLQTHTWHSVFVFGSVVTLAAIPLVYFLLPESIAFLQRKQPDNALEQVNKTLAKIKLQPVSELPHIENPLEDRAKQGRFLDLFKPDQIRATICLALAYVGQMLTFYFLMKWTPKIVVDMGYPAAQAGLVLVWANVGGVLGAVFFGILSRFISIRALTMILLVFSSAMIIVFGRLEGDIAQMSFIAFVAGLVIIAAISGFYNLFTTQFPTELRASGTGFSLGVGRSGAALSPIVAGFLFAAGGTLSTVALLMACGSILSLVAVFLLKDRVLA